MTHSSGNKGYLSVEAPLPALNDPEGDRIPSPLSRVVDSHVHIFPEIFFRAVWKWFDRYGWPIRYQSTTTELLNFILSKGVEHVVAFQYAHKPGMAGYLNGYMADKVVQFKGKLTGMATLFPGEEGAEEILLSAFEIGLKGVKLHAHVQCFDLLSKDMDLIYGICSRERYPLVIHAGREPGSPAYSCDPYEICAAHKVEEVLKTYPELRLCVPHLGMDEFDAYARMIEDYDNLWLDTAMAITDYLPVDSPPDLTAMRNDRVMYGSDFPNIPYAWDRELKVLSGMNMSREKLDRIAWKNASDFFSITF